MLALSASQLRTVMDAADGLPTEKRGIFLQRVTARLHQRGSRFTDADVDDAVCVALRGLITTRPLDATSPLSTTVGIKPMEVYLGFALLVAWALVVFWSLARVAVSAWRARGRKQYDSVSFVVGLLAGAGLAGGVALFVENEHVLFRIHTIGLGFLLALGATVLLWAFALACSGTR
jgi:hypothetical protein